MSIFIDMWACGEESMWLITGLGIYSANYNVYVTGYETILLREIKTYT